MIRGRIGKRSTSPGGTEKLYGIDVHIIFQLWLEPMLLQKKSISSTAQQCRTFQDEEDIATQRLELCAHAFLTWDTQRKARWKMDRVSSFISGARPSIRLTKDTGLHDDEGTKINTRDSLKAAQRQSGSFFVFHGDVPPIPG